MKSLILNKDAIVNDFIFNNLINLFILFRGIKLLHVDGIKSSMIYK